MFVIAIVVLVTAVYIVLGLIGLVQFPDAISAWLSGADEQLTDLERIPKLIKDTHPTDVVLLGDEILFETDVPLRTIEAISEESLQRKSGCVYSFLIINDLTNNVQLTEKSISLIAQKIESEYFCLVYLGEKYATVWDDPEQYLTNIDGNLWWKYYSLAGESYRAIGAWSKNEQNQAGEYPYMLGDIVLYEIEAYILALN